MASFDVALAVGFAHRRVPPRAGPGAGAGGVRAGRPAWRPRARSTSCPRTPQSCTSSATSPPSRRPRLLWALGRTTGGRCPRRPRQAGGEAGSRLRRSRRRLARSPSRPGRAGQRARRARTSTPPANAVLATAPSEVVLTFTEAVRQVPDKIRVIAPDGSRADTGRADVLRRGGLDRGGPGEAERDVPRHLPGHLGGQPPGRGRIHVLGRRALDAAERRRRHRDEAETSRCSTVTIPIVKYIGYAGLVLLVGPTLVLALLWPQRLSRRGADPVGVRRARAGRVLDPGRALAAGAVHDRRGLLRRHRRDARRAGQPVRHHPSGAARRADRGAPSCCGPCCRGRGGTADRALLAILAIVGLATWPLSGHPGASPVPSVSVVVDAAHLAGMAVWLGGLVMLVGFLLPQADERELGAILPVWSRWAALAVAGLFLAGTIQALIEVGTVVGAVRDDVRPGDHRQGRAVLGGDRGRGVLPAAGARAGRRVAAVPAAPGDLGRAGHHGRGARAVGVAGADHARAHGGGERDRRRGDDRTTRRWSPATSTRSRSTSTRRRSATTRCTCTRTRPGQPAAAGGRVAGDGGAAVGRHRAARDARCCRSPTTTPAARSTCRPRGSGRCVSPCASPRSTRPR